MNTSHDYLDATTAVRYTFKRHKGDSHVYRDPCSGQPIGIGQSSTDSRPAYLLDVPNGGELCLYVVGSVSGFTAAECVQAPMYGWALTEVQL